MKKRIILILIAFNFAILSIIVLRQVTVHRAVPKDYKTLKRSVPLNRSKVPGDALEAFGVTRFITDEQVQEATNFFMQERKMWTHLSQLSAGAQVEFENEDKQTVSLGGILTLKKVDGLAKSAPDAPLGTYEMILSDRQGNWTIKTDGDKNHTQVTCTDTNVRTTILNLGPECVFNMLTFPIYTFGNIYRDSVYPLAAQTYTASELFGIYVPWVSTNPLPHSYTFWDPRQSVDFTFIDGHFHMFHRVDYGPQNVLRDPANKELSIRFDNQTRTNDFWYPTVLEITPVPAPWPYPQMQQGYFLPNVPLASGGRLRITLSNVCIQLK